MVFGVSQVGLYQVLEGAMFVCSIVTPLDVCHVHSVLFRIHVVFSLYWVLDLGEFRSFNVFRKLMLSTGAASQLPAV
jgi:hypothetical protein